MKKRMPGTGKMGGVAPDGGYGWVVVMAYSITNIIVIPMLTGFSLLFRKVFHDLKLSAMDISLIININASFGMLLGLCNGPLLKSFGFRKMAIGGAVMTFIGLSLTSRANSFMEFVIFYGILPSYGFVALLASFSLAQNTYFIKRRSYASGIGMTITGIGPIVYPLFISYLLTIYDVRGTALILAAVALNALPCAMLLHPIKWHYKKTPDTEEGKGLMGETLDESRTLATIPPDLVQSVVDLESAGLQPRRVSCSVSVRGEEEVEDERVEPDETWWNEGQGSAFQSASSIPRLTSAHEALPTANHRSLRARSESRTSVAKEVKPSEKEDEKTKETFLRKIVDTFDLDLLKDPVYVNIWLGLSIAFSGEINFSLMTPVIMDERKFDITQTARVMAVIATTDIVFRFVAPFFGRWIGWPPRQMYMLALLLLVITRTALTMVSSYQSTVIVCAFLGMAKGIRTVYWTLVIPNHVPLDKLPSASSLQTVLNGVVLSFIGPLLGLLRDVTGDFNNCIHIINLFTITTLILWGLEMIVAARLKKKAKKESAAKDKTRDERQTKVAS